MIGWWDHTKPFPESAKTGCPDTDKVRELTWSWGPEKFMEKVRDAHIEVLKCRAAGHDIGYSKPPELYAMFPELQAMEDAAEASFLEKQNSGDIPPPLM